LRLHQGLPAGEGKGWIRDAVYGGTLNKPLVLLAANRQGAKPGLPFEGISGLGDLIFLYPAPDGSLYTQINGATPSLMRSTDHGRTWHK
jgi:hypothetical protein